MALINCPECGKQVSHQAIICPNCGYKVMNYVNQIRIEHSITTMRCKTKTASMRILRIIKKVLLPTIITAVSIFFLLLIASGVYDVYLRLQPEPKLDIFSYVSSNEYDPLALTAENNILGKNISSVLDGVFNGKTYIYTSDEDFGYYTFSEQIPYTSSSSAELTLYTDINRDFVNVVEYSFLISDLSSASSRITVHRIKRGITGYCNVNPVFTYMNEEGKLVEISEENFSSFMVNNKLEYYIIWEVEDLVITFYINNSTDSDDVTCSISYMNISIMRNSGPETKYLQYPNDIGGTTALRKDTASQAYCIISEAEYQLNIGGMILWHDTSCI